MRALWISLPLHSIGDGPVPILGGAIRHGHRRCPAERDIMYKVYKTTAWLSGHGPLFASDLRSGFNGI